MKLHPLIYPDIEITHFIIKEEALKYHCHDENTLILSQKNILYQFQAYSQECSVFNKYVYVKSRYGIIKGEQSWYNERGYKDLSYRIQETFETELEALSDCINLENSPRFKPCIQWIVYRDKHNQLVAYEAQQPQQNTDTAQFKELEAVECKASDMYVLNFEAEHTNNLGVNFKIHCQQLFSLVRWIKYKGKIYRAILYYTNFFQIQTEQNGKYYGINHATKSKYITHMTDTLDVIAPAEHMRMKRIWFVDEQLGGLSVRQYRRLRNKLYNAFKRNKPSYFDLDNRLTKPWVYDDRDYKADPSVHLYLDEVLRDITEEEKHNLISIADQNKKKLLETIRQNQEALEEALGQEEPDWQAEIGLDI